METEIIEQPCIVGNLLRKYIKNYVLTLDLPNNIEKIKLVASGSSYNCALLGKKFFEKIAKIEAAVEFSGEFIYDFKPVDKDTLHFFISQSGETFDTLSAARRAKEAGARTFAIVNNSNSTLYDLADYKINIEAGVENAIAATKSFTSSLVALYLCAIKAAQNKQLNVVEYMKNLEFVEGNISNVLDLTKNLDKAAGHLAKYGAFSVIGHNFNYPVAREAALKIKEITYIDVNAYAMGEFVHGHSAILNKISTIVEILTDKICDFEYKTIGKIATDYSPKSVVITDLDEDFDAKIKVVFPKFDDLLTKILSEIIIIQALALKTAQKLRRNVDRPKGLSKVVKG